MASKPNILFLMSDEHRADTVGYAGNPVVRTPVLDELARTGIVFSNAYTPSPVCIPARQAMMAGQFPRHCGCETYGEDLAPGYMTFARRLAEYGYETVVSGKLHHMGSDQMQGWTWRISGDMRIDPQFRSEEAQNLFKTFPSKKWTNAKEIARAGVGKGIYATHDQYAVEGAIQLIEDYFCDPYYDREQSQPLLLKVSLVQPHYPYLTSETKFNYYLNRVQPYTDQEVSDHPFLSQHQVRPGIDVTERELRRATAAYYGMIETIDDHFGAIVRALEGAGQHLDDWIIIYTSDHGEMLGQHGVWEKRKFYEGSCRVPLIIRYPKRFKGGRAVHQNVNLCDLFATLCELTDIGIPDRLDSRSLVPLMEGNGADWANESISQHGGQNLMIKLDQLKYQYYGQDMPELLFDLEKDPDERIDWLQHPDYQQHLTHFRQRRAELGF